MSEYQRFVFDLENRRFVGEFEMMYQAELREGFDSWHQDNLDSRFEVAFIERILRDHRYEKIIDVGCGKGSLTQMMGQYCEKILGVDVSDTAIGEANRRFPSLQFQILDIRNRDGFCNLVAREAQAGEKSTLFVFSQVLSYIENWSFLLETAMRAGADVLVALYLPVDAIGFVKTESELLCVLQNIGTILFHVESDQTRQHVVLASPRLIGFSA
jgi:SAM-dependent methyltransferase